jgi:co-chaperonin GroES (HSP10)
MGKPTSGRILVSAILEEQQSGRILVVNNKKERPQKGTVHETETDVTSVKKGNIVAFGINAGVEIKTEDGNFILLREDEIYYNYSI